MKTRASVAVDYQVEVDDAHAHRFRVSLTLRRPAAQQVFTLPVWLPGSYGVRDFARHLSALTAHQGSQPRPVAQLGTSRWQVDCTGAAALVLRYEVYAFDASVRGACLDGERGFFNGSSLFLCAEGRRAAPHRLRLARLPAGWPVASAMRSTGTRTWAVDGYDEFIDHPFVLGPLWRGSVLAAGVPHEVVVQGAWPGFDGERLLADVQRIAETHVRFWHPRRPSRPPFDRYVFLLCATEGGHGGLEHRASCALRVARSDLPRRGERDRSEGYLGLLGLVSHEYFHAWNVKRLQPAEFVAPDLSREQPSRLLWFFEGFTAYCGDLLLLRAGVIDRAQFLRQLARPLNTLRATPGRHLHSLAEASFETWTKFHRDDENTANVTVSYYAKGALVALLCDLGLRQHGSSIDEALQALWREHATPVDEARLFEALSGGHDELAASLREWVHGTGELPLAQALARAGVALHEEAPSLAQRLGLRLSDGALTGVQVRQVLRGSAAEAAGLSPGDELLAVDGWRIRRLGDAAQWLRPGEAFDVLLARDQRLHTRRVLPPAVAALPVARLDDDARADATARALRHDWLGG